MKTIYADLLGRVGFRLRQLLEHPPEGFRFVYRTQWPDKLADWAIRKDALYQLRNLANRLVPLNLLASYAPLRFKRPPWGVDLTYSESPLIFRAEPWIVGVEVATQFAGYDHRHLARYRRLVEDTLASPYCRAIICWSEAARRSLFNRLSAGRFSEKLAVLHPAGTPRTFARVLSSNGRSVRILFVGSGVAPDKFRQKGGPEALEAFVRLRQLCPQVELVVRSDVPEPLRRAYEGVPGLKFLAGMVPSAELGQLFRSSDIFWYPAHSLSSVVVLEAMSYGLAVVTSNYYDNAEFIDDGRTGMVVPQRRNVPPWDTSPHEVRAALRRPDPDFMRALVEKTAHLVENPALRQRLGRAAREEIETGRFSLERKNQQLKTIFDAAIHNRSH